MKCQTLFILTSASSTKNAFVELELGGKSCFIQRKCYDLGGGGGGCGDIRVILKRKWAFVYVICSVYRSRCDSH